MISMSSILIETMLNRRKLKSVLRNNFDHFVPHLVTEEGLRGLILGNMSGQATFGQVHGQQKLRGMWAKWCSWALINIDKVGCRACFYAL